MGGLPSNLQCLPGSRASTSEQFKSWDEFDWSESLPPRTPVRLHNSTVTVLIFLMGETEAQAKEGRFPMLS